MYQAWSQSTRTEASPIDRITQGWGAASGHRRQGERQQVILPCPWYIETGHGQQTEYCPWCRKALLWLCTSLCLSKSSNCYQSGDNRSIVVYGVLVCTIRPCAQCRFPSEKSIIDPWQISEAYPWISSMDFHIVCQPGYHMQTCHCFSFR